MSAVDDDDDEGGLTGAADDTDTMCLEPVDPNADVGTGDMGVVGMTSVNVTFITRLQKSQMYKDPDLSMATPDGQWSWADVALLP